ncbi:bifunctional glutamate N-acetyltransferase/amino-acid acetyltransferase ArgJ [Streptomyces sp. NPDC097619]|uniref:bifunctional glutamate N-acetyltransferase/amino-acid acetyltransferase ArgJ n=1 Tax=Streptomyces sp. NPDC097619 TaxID=3157228 RepID=UPI00332BB1A5
MSVTAARGFVAEGLACGIKDGGRLDLALVVNTGPHRAAAGVFTSNRVQAAPVRWSREALTDGSLAAVVLNSGGANACTGPEGEADTRRTAETAGASLGLLPAQVAVCSTGLIGVRLPMPALERGVAEAAARLAGPKDPAGGLRAARAIMTTDTVAKTAVTGGDGWTVGGMAKGAGMLAPGLATMLVVLTTDAEVPADRLDSVLREAVRTTFDRVDSDGCMSTNDTVLLLSSGASGTAPEEGEFAAAVREVCADLARQLVADAEGASKEIRIVVTGADSESDAVTVARAVSRSNLLKCALHGEDPNWGRVLSAVGTTDAVFDPARLDVEINGVRVCRDSAPGEPREKVDMSGREITVAVDLRTGPESAVLWTNDLTAAYVHENSAYSS